MVHQIRIAAGRFSHYSCRPLIHDDVFAYELAVPGSEGQALQVNAKKSDGTVVSGVGFFSGGELRYVLARNMYDVPGDVVIEAVVVGETGSRLTAARVFAVAEAGTGDSDISGNSQVPVLTELISQVLGVGSAFDGHVNDAERHITAQEREAWNGMRGLRPATVVVGHVNSGHTAAEVDFLCTGTDDQLTIQAAVDSLPNTESFAGGKVLLLGGSYHITGSVEIVSPNVTIEGMGNSTQIISAGWQAFTLAGNNACIKNFAIVFTGEIIPADMGAVTIAENGCVIDGVEFFGMVVGSGRSGIIRGADGIIVSGVRIVNCNFSAAFTGETTGANNGYVRLRHLTNSSIQGNIFGLPSAWALVMEITGPGNIITSNRINADNNTIALMLQPDNVGSLVSENNIITGNSCGSSAFVDISFAENVIANNVWVLS